MFLLRIITALEKYNVPYGVAGGVAVCLHGAVRGTVDVDLVIKVSKPCFLATEQAFASIGLEPRLPLLAKDVFEFREEYIHNRNLIAWSFFNPKKPSEIVDIIITHDLKNLKICRFDFHGHTIKVLDLNSLIRMKKDSGRPQDLEDIKSLQSLNPGKSRKS